MMKKNQIWADSAKELKQLLTPEQIRLSSYNLQKILPHIKGADSFAKLDLVTLAGIHVQLKKTECKERNGEGAAIHPRWGKGKNNIIVRDPFKSIERKTKTWEEIKKDLDHAIEQGRGLVVTDPKAEIEAILPSPNKIKGYERP